MKVICAWCKKDLGEKEPLEEKTVSHGMCEKCYSSIIEETKKELPTWGNWQTRQLEGLVP